MRSTLVCPIRGAARALAVVLVLGLPACASSGGGGSSGGSGDVITRAQIDEAQVDDAYDLVQRYRSRWLRRSRNQNTTSATTVRDARGVDDGDAFPTGSQEYAVVFYDGRYYGELAALSSFHPSQIESIEYINPREATTLYGTGYPSGVINVLPRTGGDSGTAQ